MGELWSPFGRLQRDLCPSQIIAGTVEKSTVSGMAIELALDDLSRTKVAPATVL